MSKHTPGPWVSQRSGRNSEMMGKPGWNPNDPYQCGLSIYARSRICRLEDEFGTSAERKAMREMQEANARLIAAAPDLLQACIDCREAYQQMFDVMPVAWQTFDGILEAAIKKATGEQ